MVRFVKYKKHRINVNFITHFYPKGKDLVLKIGMGEEVVNLEFENEKDRDAFLEKVDKMIGVLDLEDGNKKISKSGMGF